MASKNTVPQDDVLAAFGVDPGLPLKAFAGTHLVCYHAVGSEVVLRPSDDDGESEQIAQIMNQLHQVKSPSALYRTSRPIPLAADPTKFVYSGWTAWSFVSGSSNTSRWDDIIRTSRAFHHDLGNIDMAKPEFLDRRMDGFREADMVAWGEKRLDEFPTTASASVLSRVTEALRQLEDLKRDFSKDMPNQLVHGDMLGNTLFDEEQSPGIIDLTFYWRPARMGDAIVVADGLMWHGRGDDLVQLYGTDADSIQVLVRALIFRTARWAIKRDGPGAESDAEWAEKMLPLVNFEGPVDIVRRYID